MLYRIFTDKEGMWRWRLQDAHGKIIALSSKGYVDKAGCLRAIRIVQGSKDALVDDPTPAQLPLK